MDLKGGSGPSTDDARDEAEPSAHAILGLVQGSPEVCSNCFRKLRDVVLPHTHKRQVAKGLVKYFIPKEDRVESATFAGETSRNPPKACRDCGSIRGATNRPLSRRLALKFCWNLSTSLQHLGIEHNPLLLVATVARRKQFPYFAGTDEDNIRIGLRYSLPHTRFTLADVLVPHRRDPADLYRKPSSRFDDGPPEFVRKTPDRSRHPLPR